MSIVLSIWCTKFVFYCFIVWKLSSVIVKYFPLACPITHAQSFYFISLSGILYGSNAEYWSICPPPLFPASNMLALVSVLYKLDFFMFYYIKKSCKKACTAAIDIIVQFHLFPHCFWGGRTQNDRLYWKFGCTGITNWRHWRMFVHYRNGDNWISSIYFHARHLKLVAWSERYADAQEINRTTIVHANSKRAWK